MESNIFHTCKNEKAPLAAPFLLVLLAENFLQRAVEGRVGQADSVQEH